MEEPTATEPASPLDVQLYEIVQIDPAYNPIFGGSLIVVTKIFGWGVQGFQTMPNKGDAYVRLPWTAFARTGGSAVWLGTDQLAEGDVPENHHG